MKIQFLGIEDSFFSRVFDYFRDIDADLIFIGNENSSLEDIHPDIFNARKFLVEKTPKNSDLNIIFKSWQGEIGNKNLFAYTANENIFVPELMNFDKLQNYNNLSLPNLNVIKTFCALEPLIRGKCISPKEDIFVPLSLKEIEILQKISSGFFDFRIGENIEISIFEGYSEHDAKAVFREQNLYPDIKIFKDRTTEMFYSPSIGLNIEVMERNWQNPLPRLKIKAFASDNALAYRLKRIFLLIKDFL